MDTDSGRPKAPLLSLHERSPGVFDTMRIRTKLALALAVPLLALVGMSVVVVSDSSDEASDAAAQADQVGDEVAFALSSLGPSGAIAALSAERNAETLALLGIPDDVEAEAVRVEDDQALEDFQVAVADESQAVQDAYAPAIANLDEVEAIRARIDGFDEEAGLGTTDFTATVFDDYTELVTSLYDASSRVALGVEDASLRSGARVVDLGSRYTEALTLLIRQVSIVGLLGGGDPAVDAAEAGGLRADVDNLTAEMEATAQGPYVPIVEGLVTDPELRDLLALLEGAATGDDIDVPALLDGPVQTGAAAAATLTEQASAQLQADGTRLEQAAEAQQSAAEQRRVQVVAIVVGVVLAAVVVGLLASRSISRPMRRLTTAADEMADRRLPDAVREILESPPGQDVTLPELAPLPADGGYEVAEMAKALTTVQDSATELAVEQAVLRRNIADSFVNLGRRNQNLLSRQLDSITEMERGETDPAALEELFVLDHLATRMRRNAESLLLLAGLDPQRQWASPVSIVDVLRGALGEVEDYSRVAIDDLDEVRVTGSTASDLTHMIAELVENALHYSPPERPVELVGTVREGRYRLVVIDHGVGMTPEDLDQANTRLAGHESFTVAPSRYLGHYVVGAQAARLGITVELVDTPTGGITAKIDITAVVATADGQGPAGGSIAAAPSLATASAGAGREEERSPLGARVPDSLEDLDGPLLPVVAETSGPVLDTSPPAAPVPGASSPRLSPSGPPAPAAPSAAPPSSSVPSDPRSADAHPAASGPAPEPPDAGTTASGYRRRVPGASTPRTDVVAAHRHDGEAEGAEEAPTGRAEGIGSLLSGLQAGTDRGRAAAHASDDDAATSEDES